MTDRRIGFWLRWLAALAAVHFVLALPDRPDGVVAARFLIIPAELPLILGLLLAAPPRWRRTVRVCVGAALGLLLVAKLADIAMFAALGRPFNPVLDTGLVVYGVDLLGRVLGGLAAFALIALAVAALAAMLAALVWAFGMPGAERAGAAGRARRHAGVALAAAGIAGIALAWPGGWLPLSAWASRFVADHTAAYAGGVVDLQRFRAAAAVDPFRDVPDDRLLARLAGADVLFVFVESYGRSVVDPATGDAGARAALAELGRAVEAAGFAARTAWLTSPVRGGQSWLAHATLLSGLPIGNQRRYDSLLAGGRATLLHDFRRAGWRTVAVMPAITRAWPDAGFFGYDRFYAAADLGYRGAPFNWVTMPDQFTLASFAARELVDGDRPVMAEIALISSHAPWTPIPPLLPWDALGDGTVFTPYAGAGDPPEMVWRDPDRVREQYRKSIAYVLRTVAAFVERYGRRDMLVVLLGDHQPVPFVSGEPNSFAVPVHILAGDPSRLVMLDDWSWTAGVQPDAATPTWPMAAFRGRFLDAFTPDRAVSSAPNGRGSSATPRR